MKKMAIYAAAFFLAVGGFKIVVLEPDKPHTFQITIPSFTEIVAFCEKVGSALDEVSEDFEIKTVE